MSEINSGVSLYDLNKDLMKKNGKALTKKEIDKAKTTIYHFINSDTCFYYMLLCNERRDYTVFDFKEKKWPERSEDCVDCLVDECLKNRGEIYSMVEDKDKNAIEIWLSIGDECYLYYFFKYEYGIINDF